MSDPQQPLDTNEVTLGDTNVETEITQESNQVETATDTVGTTTVQTGETSTGEEVTDIDVQAQGDFVDVQVDLTHSTDTQALTQEQIEKLALIRASADKIKCSEFHNKGTLEEYMVLLTKMKDVDLDDKVDLDVDLSGLDSFTDVAEQLAGIVTSVTAKLDVVSQVNDDAFLDKVYAKIQKVEVLVEAMQKFKISIAATSKLKLPGSTKEVATILSGLVSETECAKTYIDYFTGVSTVKPSDSADLSPDDKLALQKAIDAIDMWKEMTSNGVSATMASNEYIKSIAESSTRIGNIDLTASRDVLANLQQLLAGEGN